MRTMSWSRYRCLSLSFMRIRAGLRHGRSARAGHKTTTRRVTPCQFTTAANSAAAATEVTALRRRRVAPPISDAAATGRFQIVIWLFRTKPESADTDV